MAAVDLLLISERRGDPTGSGQAVYLHGFGSAFAVGCQVLKHCHSITYAVESKVILKELPYPLDEIHKMCFLGFQVKITLDLNLHQVEFHHDHHLFRQGASVTFTRC